MRRKLRVLVGGTLLGCIAILSHVKCQTMAAEPPMALGLQANDQLQPCPEKPNCVSTSAIDTDHRIDPIRIAGTPAEVLPRVKQAVESLGDVAWQSEGANYLHGIVYSKFWKFPDDVEFHYLEETENLLVRSASRIGYSDLGVNRKRVEKIKEILGTP